VEKRIKSSFEWDGMAIMDCFGLNLALTGTTL